MLRLVPVIKKIRRSPNRQTVFFWKIVCFIKTDEKVERLKKTEKEIDVKTTKGTDFRKTSRPSTVILGLGNSILSDDAVGILAAREAGKLLEGCEDVVIAENERGGMDVLDEIGPYERAVLVDGIKTGRKPPGTIFLLSAREFIPTRRLSGFHDLDLSTALELARRLGLPVPEEIIVLAVEINDDVNFGEKCSPEVAAAISKAAAVATAKALGRTIPAAIEVVTNLE